MAGQENFKAVIKAHLEQRAKTDKLFAKAYKNKAKSLDECCNYIVGSVVGRSRGKWYCHGKKCSAWLSTTMTKPTSRM